MSLEDEKKDKEKRKAAELEKRYQERTKGQKEMFERAQISQAEYRVKFQASEEIRRNALFSNMSQGLVANINKLYPTGKLPQFTQYRAESRTKQKDLLLAVLQAINESKTVMPVDEKIKIAKGLMLLVKYEINQEYIHLTKGRLNSLMDDNLNVIDTMLNAERQPSPSNKESIQAFKDFIGKPQNKAILLSAPSTLSKDIEACLSPKPSKGTAAQPPQP